MPGTTNPVIRAKNKAYLSHSNSARSNLLKKAKDDKKLPIGYVTLGIILFVVVGSAIFEILKFI